jgi:4-hydroxy-tetrahydrodipicolinate synthase
VLCIPPFYYNNPPLEGLVRYYSPLLEASKIPFHLYHIPGPSEVQISVELMHKLEHYPMLAGIKDSTGNAEGYATFVKEFPKLNMMSGTDSNLPAALQAGMGAILMGGNLFTRQIATVFAAHRQGKDITEPFNKLREATQAFRGTGLTGIPGIKYGLTAFGLRESYVRPPNVDLTPEQKTQLKPKVAQLAQLT